MAYNFVAEKPREEDLDALRQALSGLELIEIFTVEATPDLVALGISIPSKVMGDPRFPTELRALLSALICDRDFRVFDLYTGKEVAATEIPDMARRIAG